MRGFPKLFAIKKNSLKLKWLEDYAIGVSLK